MQGRKEKMKIKLNKIVLLLCFSIFLSACNTKQYEIELVSTQPDESHGESYAISDEVEGAVMEALSDSLYFVHICGAVINPGVYEVTSGSRIFEVLNLAGGFTDDAATDAVNLAMMVIDGSKIQIPTVEEMMAEPPDATWVSGEQQAETGNTKVQTDLVNINTAPLESLMTLPGIGKAKAESIIRYREEKGRFNVIEDIMKISGIKDAVFGKIKDKICV